MSIKLKLLVTVLLSQMAIVIVAMNLGSSLLGWAVCIGVAAISLAILYAVFKSSLFAPAG